MSLFDLSQAFPNAARMFGDTVQIEAPLASPRPYTNPANVSLSQLPPGSSIHTGTNSTPSTFGDTVSNTTQQASDWMQNAAQNASDWMQQKAQGTVDAADTGPTTWLLSSRVVSGAVGLVCIAAGLFMFEHTRELVVNAGKAAAKVAAI